MDQLVTRQERWRVKVAQEPDLRHVAVNSPIELVLNEDKECM